MSTSRSKTRNRTTPMRVRRRQSDAKWRASVASCYESLKLIIPDSRKVSRKKISKVLILQEAENHIVFLEDILSTLLQEKASMLEKGNLQPSQNSAVSLKQIKEEFAKKIQPTVHSIPRPRRIVRAPARVPTPTIGKPPRPVAAATATGRSDAITCRLFEGENYCYLNNANSMAFHVRPHKIADHLTSDPGCLYHCGMKVMIPSEPDRHGCEYGVQGPLGLSSPQRISETVSSKAHMEGLNSEMAITMRLMPYLTDTTKENQPEHTLSNSTPKKDASSENSSLCSPWKYAALNSIQHHPAFLTPSKVTRQLPFGSPVRSPGSKWLPQSPAFGSPSHLGFKRQPLTPMQEVPSTPNLRSDDITDDEREETKSLLCTESMENMELGDEEEWQAELEEIELKRSREWKFKELQQTPYQEGREDNSSSICGEMAPQKKPKKGVKRANLFPEDKDNDVTPAKSARQGERPKCCKQLESLYEKKEKGIASSEIPVKIISIPADSQCSNFDGYFYFYRQMTDKLEKHLSRQDMESPTFARAISQMWTDMNDDQKTTLVTIAALENSNSSSSSTQLSDDLTDISVTPITNVELIAGGGDQKLGGLTSMEEDTLQCVPLSPSFTLADDSTTPFSFLKESPDIRIKAEPNLEKIDFGNLTDTLVKSFPALDRVKRQEGGDSTDKPGCQVVPLSGGEGKHKQQSV